MDKDEPLKSELIPKVNCERRLDDSTFRGPKRAIRLCLLCIILPGLLLAVPLYLKHRVYDYTIYPVAMSDMRLIDSRVSTTWCQRQLVQANTTFNAFLMPDAPRVAKERVNVSMTRHLKLSDDMKEYWGFYLLRGSTVTVSTCVRWPGASLILIRGHRHLHECAYIGDDSSEEIEELMEIVAEKGLIDYLPDVSSDDAPANNADMLTKYGPGITFRDPSLRKNVDSYRFPGKTKEEDSDDDRNAKQMKELLDLLALKAGKVRPHRSSYPKNLTDTKELQTNDIVKLLKTKLEESSKIHNHTLRVPSIGSKETANIEFQNAAESKEKIRNNTSVEEVQEILEKLRSLGPRGDRMMTILKTQMLQDKMADANLAKTNIIEKMEKSKNLSLEGVTNQSNESLEQKLLRQKRELIIRTALQNEFNADDNEKDNVALEEGYVPDGIADHHHVLNQTNMNDRSNSEFWSSFSSSEEALLNCAGLILSLPLNPHKLCEIHRNDNDFDNASMANTVTYNVPTNGYYFFVFNSENEVQENYVRVHFNIQKTIYNVTNPILKCSNSTEKCTFPLDFFSSEKVVFEFPVKNNETLWNEEFMVISECEPRTAVYVICVLSVPLIILLFAFQ